MDVNRYCLNDVIVLHARGTRGVPGVGNTKFIPSFTRMARVLGAPRGRRVEFTVNRLSTTTQNRCTEATVTCLSISILDDVT